VHDRWKLAQEHEKRWWGEYKSRLLSGKLEEFEERARYYQSYLERYLTLGPKTRVLEIGGAGAPVVNYLGVHGLSVDPLARYFSTLFGSVFYHEVPLIEARGEELPFSDQSIELVVMLNVLDHCESPAKVIEETWRILVDGGIIFMSVDTVSNLWRNIRKILRRFRKTKKYILHPSDFTPKTIFSLLMGKFEILSVEMLRVARERTERVDRLERWRRRLGYMVKGEQRIYVVATRHNGV